MGIMDWAEESKKIEEEFKRGEKFANHELPDIKARREKALEQEREQG